MAEPSGKVALVTGAARRIGRRIAERMGEAGYGVALHCSPRSRDETETVAAAIRAVGHAAAVLPADLADTDALARLLPDVGRALGPVTCLVNSAALFEPDAADAPHLLDRHLAVNLRAPVALAAAFVAQLPPGRPGAVVNIADQRVLRPNPAFFSYGISKAALWSATLLMAQDYAARDVRVNAVAPGPTFANCFDGEDGLALEVASLPLGRAVSADDIADAVLYLAGATAVTGQLIAVDAGQHLGWRAPDAPAPSSARRDI